MPSLDEVFRLHADFVWRAIRGLGAPEAVVDDLVQEVFVVLQRRCNDFDGRTSLRSWIYVLTRGVVSNHRRRSQRERRHLQRVPEPEPGPGPDEHLEARDAASLVRAFLDQLSPRKRVVFELCEIEGLAGPEAADALGLPVNTVYSRLHDARRRFRAFVHERRPVARARAGGVS